jgi:ABC-type glutathione transport system ATPase component
MLAMYDEIVGFAELEKFMDQKLKNYSSGMQVRLAFSIAIRANTPILLIDEVLAVGDSKFQNKCYAEFRKMKEDAKTIILVTHDMSAVERFCDRVLVLQSGKAKGVYEPGDAAVIYERMNAEIDQKQAGKTPYENRWGSGEVSISDLAIYDEKEGIKPTRIVNQGSDVQIKVSLENKGEPKDVTVGLAFYDTFGANMSGPNSQKMKFNSAKDVMFTIPRLSFVPGEYEVTVAVYDPKTEKTYDHIKGICKFTVVSENSLQYGKINLFGTWKQ